MSYNYENPNYYLKSKGHIFYVRDLEYFSFSSGDVYIASRLNNLDSAGYRIGARFECTKAGWPLRKKIMNASADQL